MADRCKAYDSADPADRCPRLSMASEQSNSSLLIGVVVSAATHVAALYALRFVDVEPASKVSLTAFNPNGPSAASPLAAPLLAPLPVPEPAELEQPKPPEPRKPQDLDQTITFGDDRSTIESMTWLGTDEPTTPSGRLGEVDQAALSPKPGEEGTPGSPVVATVPSMELPSPGSTAAPQPGAPAPRAQVPTPPVAEAPAPEASAKLAAPIDPALPPDPAAEKVVKPKDAPLPAPSEKILPTPGSADPPATKPDPLSDVAGQGGATDPKTPAKEKPETPADAERPGEKVEPSETEGKAKDPKAAGKSDTSETDKPSHEKGEGATEASPPAPKTDATNPDELAKDSKSPEAKPETPTSAVPNPGAPADAPPAETAPPATGSPLEGRGDGGQNRLPGRESEQESEAFTSKPVTIPMRDATVQAGKGLRIITRRAVFTNTTLVTQAPRDTLIRIRFQRDGTVKRADFVEGGSTGNPNIDEPIRNAVYRWRASGKDLEKLVPGDTLSVVVRITFR